MVLYEKKCPWKFSHGYIIHLAAIMKFSAGGEIISLLWDLHADIGLGRLVYI